MMPTVLMLSGLGVMNAMAILGLIALLAVSDRDVGVAIAITVAISTFLGLGLVVAGAIIKERGRKNGMVE